LENRLRESKFNENILVQRVEVLKKELEEQKNEMDQQKNQFQKRIKEGGMINVRANSGVGVQQESKSLSDDYNENNYIKIEKKKQPKKKPQSKDQRNHQL